MRCCLKKYTLIAHCRLQSFAHKGYERVRCYALTPRPEADSLLGRIGHSDYTGFSMPKHIPSPLDNAALQELRCGDLVLISGTMYVARDAAHKRIVKALEQKRQPPFDLAAQTIYYMGPSPAPPGRCIGSSGPTTSGRMDMYTPRLLAAGLRAMIGKGPRSAEVRKAMQRFQAVYLAAVGGAGALLSHCIRSCETIAYPELGAEALRRIEVELFPAVVVNDIYGGDLYEHGRNLYRHPLQDTEASPA